MRLTPALAAVILVAVVVVAAPSAVGAATPTRFEGGAFVSGPEGDAPAIATNGPRTLVVHQAPGTVAGATAVYGTLLTSGTDDIVADFTVATSPTRSYGLPDLAWNGTHWLVVFEARNLSSGDRTIAARRVSAAGGLVGGVVNIGSTSGSELRPAAAAGPDGQWAVTWETTMAQASTSADIRVGRVSSDGAPLDGLTGQRASIDTTNSPSTDRAPDIAWGANRYVVTWQQAGSLASSIAVFGLRANGAFGGFSFPISTAPSSPLQAPSIASDGTQFLIAFELNFGGTSASTDIYGLELRIRAGEFESESFPLASMNGAQRDPAVAWNGAYLVAWIDPRDDPAGDVYGVHLPTVASRPDDSDSFLLNTFEGSTGPAVTGGAAPHRFMDAYSITGYGIFTEGMRFAAPK